MSRVKYTAKRSIISSHVLDTLYELEFDTVVLDRVSIPKRKEFRSIGGTGETVLHRLDPEWTISTEPIEFVPPNVTPETSDLRVWREFFDSVAAQESFVWDPYGTIASPGTELTVKMIGTPREVRLQLMDHFNLSFKVRELSIPAE